MGFTSCIGARESVRSNTEVKNTQRLFKKYYRERKSFEDSWSRKQSREISERGFPFVLDSGNKGGRIPLSRSFENISSLFHSKTIRPSCRVLKVTIKMRLLENRQTYFGVKSEIYTVVARLFMIYNTIKWRWFVLTGLSCKIMLYWSSRSCNTIKLSQKHFNWSPTTDTTGLR